MQEPDRFKQDCMKNAKIPYSLIFRRYGFRLMGVSVAWYARLIALFWFFFNFIICTQVPL